MPSESLAVKSGSVIVELTFDVGNRINLRLAGELLTDPTARAFSPLPNQYIYGRSPIRVVAVGPPFKFSKLETGRGIEITLWEFGAISIAYRIPLPEGTTLEEVVKLSTELRADNLLQVDAKQYLMQVVEVVSTAIDQLEVSTITEDYVIFSVDSFNHSISARALIKSHAPVLCRIIRQDSRALSTDVHRDVMRQRHSQTPNDVTIIDSYSSFTYGDVSKAVESVLAFGGVMLLALRVLDQKIDTALDKTDDMTRAKRGLRLFRSHSLAFAEVTRMIRDFSSVREEVENGLNIIGDPTLVKIHDLALSVLQINRLLNTVRLNMDDLKDVRNTIRAEQDTHKSHVLEWVVIALISAELLFGEPFHSLRDLLGKLFQ